MGQQQLLLLVLGIVIVGLAVVVGIQAFSENQKKANADALVNDVIRIASDAQAWKLKPQAFGGGANETMFDTLTLTQLGYTVGDNTYTAHTAGAAEFENLNGTFAISVVATGLEIVATSYDAADAPVNIVTTQVEGTEPSDITTVITN